MVVGSNGNQLPGGDGGVSVQISPVGVAACGGGGGPEALTACPVACDTSRSTPHATLATSSARKCTSSSGGPSMASAGPAATNRFESVKRVPLESNRKRFQRPAGRWATVTSPNTSVTATSVASKSDHASSAIGSRNQSSL